MSLQGDHDPGLAGVTLTADFGLQSSHVGVDLGGGVRHLDWNRTNLVVVA